MKQWIVVSALVVLAVVLFALAAPVLAANVVVNYGFETGTGADASGWIEGTQHIRTSERAHLGAYSFKSEYLEAATYSTSESPVAVTAGTWYVSYWAWRDSADGTAWLQIDYYYGADPVFATTTDIEAWQFVSGTWEVGTADNVILQLHTDGITAGVYFDDLCISMTESDCAQNTPTPTETNTPSETRSPTVTLTPSNTPTVSKTPTLTGTVSTATPSETPTPTMTKTPLSAFAWAPGLVEVDTDMLEDIEDLLTLDPPEGSTGDVFAVTDAAAADGGWIISLVNVVGVEPPYSGWSLDEHAAWVGSVLCTGDDPDYICEYYNPMPGMGGYPDYSSMYLPFPWKPGTRAQYGMLGVHGGTNSIANSRAVDFFGSDLWENSMPPEVYAVEAGTVTYVCRGLVNLGVKVSGAHDFYYLHLTPNTQLQNGDTVLRGQRLGLLVYGSFNDYPCGYADQQLNKYHVHFAFYAPSGYLTMGGCTLNVSTGIWVCGTDAYGPLSFLTTNRTGPTPDDEVLPGLGGDHIWDGIVAAVVNTFKFAADSLFPTTLGTTVALGRFVVRAQQTIATGIFLAASVQAYLGATALELFLLVWFILTMELFFVGLRLVAWVARIVGKFAKFIF